MGLRQQLLWICLLLVLIPLSARHIVQEMEASLQHNQRQHLLTTAQTGAALLAPQLPPQPSSSSHNSLYLFQQTAPIIVDGYLDDWLRQDHDWRIYSAPLDNQLALMLSQQGDTLYAFIQVDDDRVIYNQTHFGSWHHPGDEIRLSLTSPDGQRHEYHFATSAPGLVQARPAVLQHTPIPLQGVWVDTLSGFNLEIAIPRSLVGAHLALSWLDADLPASPAHQWLGTLDPRNPQHISRLVRPDQLLTDYLQRLDTQQLRWRILNRDGWILAQSDPLPSHQDYDPETPLNRLYRWLAGTQQIPASPPGQGGRIDHPAITQTAHGQPSFYQYRQPNSQQVVAAATAPLNHQGQQHGILQVEQSTNAILSITQSTLLQAFALSTLTMLVITGAFLAFASWLSYRIRRLRQQVERLGQRHQPLPTSTLRTQDEIGDLARSFQQLWQQVHSYTDYLRTLASKLSHELRTPLTIVRSSLEHLSLSELKPEERTYAQRALEGSQRLQGILSAMSAANQVENSLQHAELERFDWQHLLTSLYHAYQSAYPKCQFQLQIPAQASHYYGAPDLLAQMLDKLIENAVDFSPAQGVITLALTPSPNGWQLQVTNSGPLLPEHFKDQLFESLVSMRSGQQDSPHLGLGLYIVRLIAEFHEGQVSAHNHPQQQQVSFCIHLPHSQGPLDLALTTATEPH